jgi:hypothetical protein
MYSNKKIIFITRPFTDGSGDYSMIYKLITLFRKIGIKNENILTIIPHQFEIFEYFATFNKEFNKNCKTDIYKGTTDKDHLLNNTNILEFNEILLTICKQLTILYKMNNQPSFCDNGKFYIQDEQTRKSDATKEQVQTVAFDDSNVVKLDDRVFKQKINYSHDSVVDVEPLDFRNKIKDIIATINDDGVCTINKESLTNFLLLIDTPSFYIGVHNMIKFFLSSDIKNTNFKYYELEKIKNITPAELDIENELCDTIVISFLFYEKLLNTSLALLPRIKLSEGGYANIKTELYAPGYIKNNIYTLGINYLDYTTIKDISIESQYYNERLSIVISESMIYNVCYFGYNIDLSFWNNLLILYKLKYFVEKIIECQDLYNIYINENIYIVINKYFDEITVKILPNIIKGENQYVININNKIVYIRYYKPMTNDKFINFINKSQDMCILSGDQSYFEGISLAKLVIYDMPAHKTLLYSQILKMYRDYSNDLTCDEVIDEMINKLNMKQIDINKAFLDNPNIDFSGNNIILSKITESRGYIIDVSNIFTFDASGILFQCHDYYMRKINTPAIRNMYGRSQDIKINYMDIKNIYDFNYKINKLAIDNKNNFRCFLNEKYNFNKNLINIINQKFFKNSETLKNKYLKYKNKYIQLKMNYK